MQEQASSNAQTALFGSGCLFENKKQTVTVPSSTEVQFYPISLSIDTMKRYTHQDISVMTFSKILYLQSLCLMTSNLKLIDIHFSGEKIPPKDPLKRHLSEQTSERRSWGRNRAHTRRKVTSRELYCVNSVSRYCNSNNNAMGRLYIRQMEEENVYHCLGCSIHLSSNDQVISKSFHGRSGRAYLMNEVINSYCGE